MSKHISLFDSRSPHPDCRIMGAPGPKVNGLTMSQSAARRRVDHIGVLKPIMQGGPVGLGMRSTVCSCPKLLIVRRWSHGPKTPGQKMPRSPKPPKENPVFYSKILKGKAIQRKEVRDKLEELTRFHLAIVRGKCGPKAEQSYRDQRHYFLLHNASYRTAFHQMEKHHINAKRS